MGYTAAMTATNATTAAAFSFSRMMAAATTTAMAASSSTPANATTNANANAADWTALLLAGAAVLLDLSQRATQATTTTATTNARYRQQQQQQQEQTTTRIWHTILLWVASCLQAPGTLSAWSSAAFASLLAARAFATAAAVSSSSSSPSSEKIKTTSSATTTTTPLVLLSSVLESTIAPSCLAGLLAEAVVSTTTSTTAAWATSTTRIDLYAAFSCFLALAVYHRRYYARSRGIRRGRRNEDRSYSIYSYYHPSSRHHQQVIPHDDNRRGSAWAPCCATTRTRFLRDGAPSSILVASDAAAAVGEDDGGVHQQESGWYDWTPSQVLRWVQQQQQQQYQQQQMRERYPNFHEDEAAIDSSYPNNDDYDDADILLECLAGQWIDGRQLQSLTVRELTGCLRVPYGTARRFADRIHRRLLEPYPATSADDDCDDDGAPSSPRDRNTGPTGGSDSGASWLEGYDRLHRGAPVGSRQTPRAFSSPPFSSFSDQDPVASPPPTGAGFSDDENASRQLQSNRTQQAWADPFLDSQQDRIRELARERLGIELPPLPTCGIGRAQPVTPAASRPPPPIPANPFQKQRQDNATNGSSFASGTDDISDGHQQHQYEPPSGGDDMLQHLQSQQQLLPPEIAEIVRSKPHLVRRVIELRRRQRQGFEDDTGSGTPLLAHAAREELPVPPPTATSPSGRARTDDDSGENGSDCERTELLPRQDLLPSTKTVYKSIF